MDENQTITANKDNDRKLMDTIKPKKDDDTHEESVQTQGKLEYFTE